MLERREVSPEHGCYLCLSSTPVSAVMGNRVCVCVCVRVYASAASAEQTCHAGEAVVHKAMDLYWTRCVITLRLWTNVRFYTNCTVVKDESRRQL